MSRPKTDFGITDYRTVPAVVAASKAVVDINADIASVEDQLRTSGEAKRQADERVEHARSEMSHGRGDIDGISEALMAAEEASKELADAEARLVPLIHRRVKVYAAYSDAVRGPLHACRDQIRAAVRKTGKEHLTALSGAAATNIKLDDLHTLARELFPSEVMDVRVGADFYAPLAWKELIQSADPAVKRSKLDYWRDELSRTFAFLDELDATGQ